MDNVIALRRALHQIPELDRELQQTLKFVKAQLEPLSCKVSECAGGLLAYFDMGKADCTAFRADMDALPLQESTCAPYASRNPGKMHACGHDGHTAMLLSLAQHISAAPRPLPHNILLIFQPAEETSGGARGIVDSGELEKLAVRRIFGCHIWPGLPKHSLYSLPGPLLLGCREITVTIRGRSVHIARAAMGSDALLAGAEFLLAAYEMERRLPENCRRLLKFGCMESGSVCNVISDYTRLLGSLRGDSRALMEEMMELLEKLAKVLSEKHGCKFELEYGIDCPPVVNDEALYNAASHAAGILPLAEPLSIGEDFSCYSELAPSCFFLLGAGDAPALHSTDFDFDDSILESGVKAFEKLMYLE